MEYDENQPLYYDYYDYDNCYNDEYNDPMFYQYNEYEGQMNPVYYNYRNTGQGYE